VVGSLAAVVASRPDASSPIDRAQALVAADDNFATATESGVTFTKVSRALEDAGDDCREDRDGHAECDSFYAASGYARVSAVAVLRCTRPGVFDARASMRQLLDQLDAGGTVRIPAVTTC
jgi:hypothetical protein